MRILIIWRSWEILWFTFEWMSQTTAQPTNMHTSCFSNSTTTQITFAWKNFNNHTRHPFVELHLRIKSTFNNHLIYQHTGCPRRNVPDFGRVFLMLKYTDITQNTYVQSWTVTEIIAREVWNFDSCYTLVEYQIHIKTGRNMWFL